MTRKFTGWHMAAITVSFFAVIIGVNITLAFFAESSWTGLVVQNSYIASQSFDKDKAIAKQQSTLGWVFQVDVTSTAANIAMLDSFNKPVEGLNLRLVLERPTSEKDDIKLVLLEQSPGLYRFASPIAPGVWIADATAESADHKIMRSVQRIIVK